MKLKKAIFLPSFFCMVWMLCATAFARDPGLPTLTKIAPDVYAIIGRTAEPTPSNHGVVGNVGVIVAEDGVILIGTGTSARFAKQLIKDIREVTGKAVILGINTHQNPAFVFGNGTLAAAGVPILAHADVDGLIAQRCMRCLKLLQSALGAEAMQGTEVVRPSLIVRGSTTIAVGGRVLDIIYHGHTSAPGSIAVLDRASNVLFGGGMISIDRIPDVKDANLSEWRQALGLLQALKPVKIVPGEGPVVTQERLYELDQYLSLLAETVRAVYQRRVGLIDATSQAQLPAFRSWGLYDPLHQKNVEQVYLRLERAALAKD